ncbi:MAG: PilX N-terminal domain-containing pilus assembly protein [Gammaproteobacteria bacterium]|nr:PilX N-terminal domain-containing pilus assembly protein [Gammaproteobacteria bacterium]
MPIQHLHPLPGQQRGAALITGLLIMIVMTLIGISAMESSFIQTNLASNAQLDTVSFQTTETALARADDNGTLLGEAINNATGGSTTTSSQAILDRIADTGGTIAIATTVNASLCGEFFGPFCEAYGLDANESETEVTSKCFGFTLAAETTAGAQAMTAHTLISSRPVPGRQGNALECSP